MVQPMRPLSSDSAPPNAALDGWHYSEHVAEIKARYDAPGWCHAISNYGPQPKQRMMEKGFSYAEAAVIENEVYRGLCTGDSYDACFARALAAIRGGR